jgi:hypothetical protein
MNYFDVLFGMKLEAKKHPAVIKKRTGNPIELTDGADAPLVKCVSGIQGSQDLHGYDKPWVGGAGSNKWDEEWELGTDGYNKRYDYPFGHIFTRGCDLSEIRLWDALGTPLNSESLNEEVSSAQLGTAPTPAVGQVTVNGQPWTSGKSYKAKKKKKKIKESSALTLTHTLKRLVENSLTNKIDETLIEWLDKFGFKNLKSDGGFVYEKELNDKNHVIVYNKAENSNDGIYSIRYFIFNEDMPSGTDFDKTWEIFNVEQLKEILKSIEQEMN